MLSGKILRDQLVLASKCLSGAFTADRVVSALLFSFVDKQEKLKKGQSRVNSSRHIVIDEETCQEIIMSLGNSRETRDVLRFFGVTLARQPRINYTMSCVPSCSMKSDSTLRENLRCVLPLLGADGTSSKRNWFLAVDESYWTPMWQLVSGLRGGDSRCILGGSFNYDSDYSEIPSTEQTPGDEFLSRMTLDFLVGSTVSWTICSVPVPQGAGQGKSKMQVAILDSILSLAAELGSLPMGIATDAGTVNTQTQDLLLCAAKPEEPSRFFSQCQANSLQYLPYCVWGYLTYKSHPVLGVLDCLHSLKRYSYHIHSSSRCVFWGRWFHQPVRHVTARPELQGLYHPGLHERCGFLQQNEPQTPAAGTVHGWGVHRRFHRRPRLRLHGRLQRPVHCMSLRKLRHCLRHAIAQPLGSSVALRQGLGTALSARGDGPKPLSTSCATNGSLHGPAEGCLCPSGMPGMHARKDLRIPIFADKGPIQRKPLHP